MFFFIILDKTGRTDLGRLVLHSSLLTLFNSGVTFAIFHWHGQFEVRVRGLYILIMELQIYIVGRFYISTLTPSRSKDLLLGIGTICLKTKSSLTGGIINLVSLFILLSTKLEIMFTDV